MVVLHDNVMTLLSLELRTIFERAVLQAHTSAAHALAHQRGSALPFAASSAEACVYAAWQQLVMLRCLAECGLLLDERGTAMTLEDGVRLAADRGAAGGWALAARY